MKLGRAVQVPPTNIGQNYLELGGSSVKLGSAMKMPSLSAANRPVAVFFGHRENATKFGLFHCLRTTSGRSAEKGRGFTLVEMLVVVTIIGILASLITAAAVAARRKAKIAAIVTEISQLDMALKAYKARFGEYPPDGLNAPTTTRHLQKAFPRWNGTLPSSVSWLTDTDKVGKNPLRTLVFFLGGMMDTTNKRMIGFSANLLDPFETTSTNRIGPFYEFDWNRLGVKNPSWATTENAYRYWHQGASYATNSGHGAMVYFRAENGNYTMDGLSATASNIKNVDSIVYPAADWRVTQGLPYSWINPQTFQIFSFGTDCAYSTTSPVLQYPTGTNYGVNTFDDITNFSNGTLEDAIP